MRAIISNCFHQIILHYRIIYNRTQLYSIIHSKLNIKMCDNSAINHSRVLLQSKLNFANNCASSSENYDSCRPARKRQKLGYDKPENVDPFDEYDFFGDNFDKESQKSLNTTQETVSAFSIHRLPVNKLQRKFNGKILKEEDIIDEIMKQVNSKCGYTRDHFEKRNSCSQPASSTSTENSANQPRSQNTKYGFQTAVYVQKLYYKDKFLSLLDIDEYHVRINKIIFYYKSAEIFAVTIGSTWQAIQPFSCYDFPYEISGRLTSTEGSVQETLKPLTGNVRSSKTTKKNASLFDQLNNMRYNVVKEVRPDSSLYWLQEFSWEDKTATKIRFGLAYIRIEKCMKPENIPEILNHFSLICNKQNTLTFPDAEDEKHFDDLPMIRPVPANEYKLASEHLCKLIYAFMHNHQRSNRIQDLDFTHKHVEDFTLARDFQVKYDNGHGVSYIIQRFSRCPTASVLFSTLREKCKELTTPDYSKFKARLASNIKLTFNVNGNGHECKVWDLVEGEISLEDDGDFCRILGQWCVVRDEYHFEVQKKFLELLRKDNTLLLPGEKGHLPLVWNTQTMKTVTHYVQSYVGMPGYVVPSSVSRDLFDLLYISPERQPDGAYLYYIFDRFDAGIRDCSTRVLKSLEAIFRDDSTSKNSRNVVESHVQKFYNRQSANFRAQYPTLHHFQKVFDHGNVHIIVAFLTNQWKDERKNSSVVHYQKQNARQITKYFSSSCRDNKDNRIQSLYHERTLELSFNLKNVQSFIISRLSAECQLQLFEELGVSTTNGQNNIAKASQLLLSRLLEIGYCFGQECSEDKSVSGKLLKIRNSADFKLFPNNSHLNSEVFMLIQRQFITQFPGFIQKLECFRIHENVMQWPRIKLMFTEIEV